MNRWFGSLTSPEVSSRLTANSILCLPIGSYEQHGPHLPLQTDTVIAEQFTRRVVDRYGDKYALWILPSMPYGLSLEHRWSCGTISMRIDILTRVLNLLVAEYVRATPSRRLLIVNGHGGNRGILESAIYELQTTHSMRICVIHPTALSTVRVDSALPEIHGGRRETSVMLALDPGEVYLERLPNSFSVNPSKHEAIKYFVLDRGVSWPWTSDDDRLASLGVIGDDPHLASAEIGEAILSSALDACEHVLQNLSSPNYGGTDAV